MPFGTLKLMPGVNVEQTPTLLQAGISQSQLIRFRANLPEKLGGWSRFYPLNYSSPIRDLHAWEGINNDTHLAVGAQQTLGVITAGQALDITPATLTTNPAVDFSTVNATPTVTIVDSGITPTVYDTLFLTTPVSIGGIVLAGSYAVVTVTGAHSYTITAASNATSTVNHGGAVPSYTTTNGSAAVTVTLADHTYTVGSAYNAAISTTGGGVTIFGNYIVQSVPTANTFTIIAAQAASAGATFSENAGNANIVYYIGQGPPATGAGYGLGGYGTGGYGTGTTTPGSTGTPITAVDWTFDNWGEVLLACPQDGPVYSWSPDSGFTTAVQVFGTPTINRALFVAMPAQILVCLGSSTGGVQDPLLVKWSDSGDYTNFVVSSLTQAGSFRIPTGSKIIGGFQAPQQGLIWTDLDVWSMQYIEPPLVFGFNKLATGCGAVSSHAMAQIGNAVYWMGLDQFYVLSGNGVSALPCDVWDQVFQNLDRNNLYKVRAASNSGYDEVAWYYPSLSGGTGEVDSYVKVNIGGQSLQWDYGSLARSAWIDQSVLGEPIAATPTGIIYQHEISPDADGAAMTSSFTTGYFVLSEAEEYSVLDFIIPDFKYGYVGSAQMAVLTVTVLAVDFPGDTPRAYGPFTLSAASQFVSGVRVRGRQIAFQFQSNDFGTWWRYGALRFRFAPMGRR